MYEGALRVPFLMQWKGKISPGEVYAQPVSSMDIFATAATWANAEIPDQVEGVNLLPYLDGDDETEPHETLFWRQGNKTALRHQDWKLVQMGRRGRGTPENWELYHLPTDLSETHDRSTEEPEKLAELKELWQTMNAEMKDPLF